MIKKICFHKKGSYFWVITQLLVLFCVLFFQRDLSAQNYHYWWLTRKGSLVSSLYDGKKLNIKQPLIPAERRSMIAVDPSDNSCWVTNTLNGEIYNHSTSGQKITVKGFAAPVALVVDAKKESVWVADAAINLLLRVNSNGQIDQKIPARSIKSLVLGTDGNCWMINWRGIQPVIDQEIMPPIVKSVVHASHSIAAQTVWCIDKKGTVYRIGDNTIRHTPFVLPDSKGISATSDGGAWILRSTMAIHLSAEIKPIGEVTGFKNAKNIVSQPTDNSIWVIDNGYDRAIRLPTGDETIAVKLMTITGWNKVADKKSLNLVQSDRFDWARLSRAKAITEIPLVSEVSDIEAKPSSTEKTSSINHGIEKQNSFSGDKMNLKVVEIQPSETFNQTPDFPKGGVLLIELFDNLNQRRIKDTEQMLGRRYVWNFDKSSYTLLLGLSLEAYNTYSNRPRQKWTKMVVEGTSIGQQLNEKMAEIAKAQSWSREKYANFIVSFAKSLPYTADATSTGYDEFKMYAFETLVAGGGDCEDTVILAASILRAAGYQLMILNPEGHLALGIAGNFSGAHYKHNDQRYFYSETTGTGWEIGQVPDEYQSVPVTMHEVPIK